MAIKTKLTSLQPAADRLKREITLISGGYSLRDILPGGKLTVFPWDSEISEWIVEKAGNDAGVADSFSSTVVGKITRLPAETIELFVQSELLLIMLVARALTSDGKLKYRARCPHCGTDQVESMIEVPGQLGVIGAKAPDYVGFDLVTLPRSQDIIKVRPLLVRDMHALEGAQGGDISQSGRRIITSIMTVNDGEPESMKELLTYYRALDPQDVEFLTRFVTEHSPALDTAVPHQCDKPKCAKQFKYNLAFNYDFFLPSLR